ncbi:prepilin-type N-terminal cleavage/methylation domain-containing protein [Candidatus Peregrinibacteria bacterium]|nr:prepilin-type N-terminal cleavage/methylation domain-containing protein [Candidatus Peregrinibacteria bacterium]
MKSYVSGFPYLKKGFTLVELVVVITIILILVSALLFFTQDYVARARLDVGAHSVVATLTSLRTRIQSGYRYVNQKNDVNQQMGLGAPVESTKEVRCLGIQLNPQDVKIVSTAFQSNSFPVCDIESIESIDFSSVSTFFGDRIEMTDFQFSGIFYQYFLVLFAPPHGDFSIFGYDGNTFTALRSGNAEAMFFVRYGTSDSLKKKIILEPLTGRMMIQKFL